jgi:hypothetical protein
MARGIDQNFELRTALKKPPVAVKRAVYKHFSFLAQSAAFLHGVLSDSGVVAGASDSRSHRPITGYKRFITTTAAFTMRLEVRPVSWDRTGVFEVDK